MRPENENESMSIAITVHKLDQVERFTLEPFVEVRDGRLRLDFPGRFGFLGEVFRPDGRKAIRNVRSRNLSFQQPFAWPTSTAHKSTPWTSVYQSVYRTKYVLRPRFESTARPRRFSQKRNTQFPSSSSLSERNVRHFSLNPGSRPIIST